MIRPLLLFLALLLFAPVPGAAAQFASDRITVTVKGSGPDVVLIPGLTSSRAIWNGTVAAVPGYRYHLVQVNGFAGTAAGGNASGAVVEPVARDIARYISTKNLRAPALIGHSMGGTLAMMVAMRAPATIGRVMVVDMLPQPAGLFGGNASSIGPLADSLRGALTSTAAGRRLLGNLIGRYGVDRDSDPDVVARATHDLALIDLSSQLPKIAAPMTVLFATPGTASPEHGRIVQNYRAAYAGAKTARLRPIGESGHVIMADQPKRFHDEVKRFLTP